MVNLISAPPKTRQIEKILKDQIVSGHLKPGERLGSIRALARKFSVSNKIIECVFDRLASEKLVVKAAGCGTFVAEREKAPFTRTIGLVMMLKEMHPHAIFPTPFSVEAAARGYLTSTFELESLSDCSTQFKRFIKHKPSAVVIDGHQSFPFDLVNDLPEETKVVFFDQFERSEVIENASYVLSDYISGGLQATNELIRSGRRKIAVITSSRYQDFSTSSQFLHGVEKALGDSSLTAEFYMDPSEIDEEFWMRMLKQNRPDGIVSFGDCRVIDLFSAASRLNIRIPDDIAVMGYFNTPWAQAFKMSSVSLNETLIIKKVFDILDDDASVNIRVEPSIVYRDSCPESN